MPDVTLPPLLSTVPPPPPPPPPPPREPIDVLGDMFTEIIATTNAPGRAHLADVVEYCHTRRALGLDTRALPVVFYTQTDAYVQAVTLPHLEQASGQSLEQDAIIESRRSRPFGKPAFDEHNMVRLMDPETRLAYLRIRHHIERPELCMLAKRFVKHLEDPEKYPEPLQFLHLEMHRAQHLHSRLGSHRHPDDFSMQETGDGEDEEDCFYSEDEDLDEDENEDSEEDDDIESEYTEMSLVTRESEAVIQEQRNHRSDLHWSGEQTSKANDEETWRTDSDMCRRDGSLL